MYLLNQIGWDNFTVRKRFSPYCRLTLEFLSSLYYDPNRGLGQSESPTPPDSPQPYENQNANLPDATSHVSCAHHINPPIDFNIVIHALHSEVDFLIGGLTSLRVDLLGFTDVPNEQFDHMFQQVYSL
ncbi:hypothetical protein KIW84_063856 [Lathyrus oleraceus]|uniref:Uncharacterized protein n=1 Tax=Pisum sativum TaxID=3888 RepID=A0A9D4WB00_PEA|nr:hypothetical protein KIW84_063856 [Pisum sativum]